MVERIGIMNYSPIENLLTELIIKKYMQYDK